METDSQLDRGNVEDVMALTSLQEGLLFHYLKDPAGDFYFEQLSLEISGFVDIPLFEQAWNIVVEINGMLRTVFRWEKLANPIQVVLKTHRLRLRYHDPGAGTAGITEAREQSEALKVADRNETFDLQEVPFRVTLCRIAECRYVMIISSHHILFDGWSSGIVLNDFFNTYTDLTGGKVIVKPARTSFKEFIRWNQQQDAQKREIFWKEYLRGIDTDNRTELPVKRRCIPGSQRENPPAEAVNYTFRITFDHGKESPWDDFIRAYKMTPAALLYGAWGMLLQKYVNRSDVIFGTTVSGRSAQVEGIEEMVGLFINTVPLRFSVGESPADRRPVKEILGDLNRSLQAREAYEHTPLVKIYQYCGGRPEAELFDSLAVVENYPLDVRRLRENGPLSVVSYSMVESTHYDLTVVLRVTESIEVEFLYREERFEREDIRRLGTHFTRIIRGIVENPQQDISGLTLLSGEERRRILEDFNNSGADYPRDKTLHRLFEEQAERTPDTIAVSTAAVSVTYRRINEQSHQLARTLRQEQVAPGAVVGIMVERSIEMVIGILGILKSGGAYLPIAPRSPEERTRWQLENCSASLLLTTRPLTEKGRRTGTWKGETGFIDAFKSESGDREDFHRISFDSHPSSGFAYVIFTSGSTGQPKGVPITHANLSPLLHWGFHRLGISAGDRTLHNLAYYFDWSVWEIFITLTTGARLFVVPDDVLLDPRVCIAFINKHEITVLHATPTQYGYLAGTGQKTGTLKYLFLGAEKLSFDLAERSFKSVSNHCRVFNMYGPTEATIISSTLEIHHGKLGEFRELSGIPIGQPIANAGLFVLDRCLNPCPVNIGGELYISGDGVAAGYVNDPALTAEKFCVTPPSLANASPAIPPAAPFYRTGDLARWLPDGNIEFLGRSDSQVKIRGFRIEPGEIETLLMKHAGVKEVVVTEVGGTEGKDKCLCAYVVPAADTPNSDPLKDLALKAYLASKLPDYMVPSYFVPMKRIPLNPNGKLDRNVLPVPRLSGAGGIANPPRNELEHRLARIWAEVLDGGEAFRASLGIDEDFFHLGGHSLKAMALSSKIHRTFDAKVPVSEIFRSRTIRNLAEYIRTAAGDKYAALDPVEEKEYYSLSSAQKRLYILHQGGDTGTRYNMSAAVQIEGEAGKKMVEAIFGKLIRRHESFRTSFEFIDNQPVQRIHPRVEFEIEYFEVQGVEGDVDRVIDRFVRPFELSEAPLLRVGLIKAPGDRHTMVVDMHHIISDEISMEILEREFRAFAAGEELPPLSLRYRDFSAWQNRLVGSPYLENQERYWLNRFNGDIPVLNMPLDFPRPHVSKAAGHSISFEIGSGITRGLRQLAAETETTMFMVLLAAYNILLSKYSGQEDIIVGTPIVGRSHSDLEKIVGLFVNILPVRNRPEGDKRTVEFLEEVKSNALGAYENQEYPFETLVWNLKLKADPGRSPLFDTAFVLRKAAHQKTNLRPYEIRKEKIHNELILVAVEGDHTLSMVLEYSTELFKESTARKLSVHYIEILEQIIGNRGKQLKEITISHGLTAAEPGIIPDDRGDFNI